MCLILKWQTSVLILTSEFLQLVVKRLSGIFNAAY